MPDDCLFCSMASGKIPVPTLYADDEVFVIRDIHPQAPLHLLVIPREHIPDAGAIQDEHGPLLALMFRVAREVAEKEGAQKGYRLALNRGPDAGMAIAHLHMHLLAGRTLGPEG